MTTPVLEGPLSLLEAADALGRYRYAELALFSELGRRATSCTAPEAVVALATASRAHAFRAALFESCLPVSVGLPDAAVSTRSPGTNFEEVLSILVQPGPDEELFFALAELVYPAFAIAYGTHLARSSPFADPPISRAVERAMADLACARRELAAAGAAVGLVAGKRAGQIAELLAVPNGLLGSLHGHPREAQ